MRRCAAHLCPDDVSESAPEGVLCDFHWCFVMTAEMREFLSSSWGKESWPEALASCLRTLRQIEAEKSSQPW